MFIFIEKYKNFVLCFTSFLILVSFLYFLQFSDKNIYECILGSALIITFICSETFWINPKKYSWPHITDSIIAKITILCFIIYTFFLKKMQQYHYYSYTPLVLGMIYFAYKSHTESSKEWCSTDHIKNHFFLHLFCFTGSLYAFV